GLAGARQFAMVMMLITSFGASIGGMGTPVGTPPNLIGVGMLQKLAGVNVTFFQWMLIGVPVMVLMFGMIGLQFYFAGARHVRVDASSTQMVREELDKLGRVSRGQRNVLTAFGITVLLWVAPGIFAITGIDGSGFAKWFALAVPESVAALLGAMLLYLLPVDWTGRKFTLTWDQALKIDW